MYYLELLQKFWDFNKNVLIGSNAIAMYLYLLKLGNDCNGYCIKVSDVEISKTLQITRKTVIPTKEKLRDLGLIQYETKNGIPCSYRLILNYNIHIQEPVKNKTISPNRKVGVTPVLGNFENNVTWDEFISYAQSLEGYESFMDNLIHEKYVSWTNSGWKNNYGRPITNWKSSLKSIFPYLVNQLDEIKPSLKSIPNIKYPNSSMDE